MRRRLLVPLAVVGVLGTVVLISGCPRGASPDPWASAGSKPKVLVSFAPLYSFAAAVAGPDAEVKCLLTTTGPHTEGDATSGQIALARGCDVFIINGLGMEDAPGGFADKLGQVAANPKWHVLNLGSNLDKDWLLEGECHHDHDHGKAGEEHEHGIDPHVWLSIRCAKKMVEGIRDELVRLDSDHAAGYKDRSAAYLAKLDKLEAEGKAMMDKKQEKWILSFHESLNYFAHTFGLKVAGSIQVDPGMEPSPEKIKQIIKKCQNPNKPVRVIAVEPQFPNNSSARVVRDTLRGLKDQPIDAEFAEVDPLETCDEKELGPDLYENVMRRNLTELARVLR
jgi:ABC-type Zn uptake system ZnuABC Zn-binding protein ZnuA